MTVELWLHLEHGVPRMSDPMNERPGDPQPPPPEAERKSSSPLIWILILIALIAFAWYFYNRNAGSESIGDLTPPAATSDAMTPARSEEHTSELQSLIRISYAIFCLKKKT